MAARLYRTVFGLMWAAVVVGAFMLWHSPSMGSATFRPQGQCQLDDEIYTGPT